ncbi:MAG: hypothetical protein LBV59_24045 [Sphingobacterium sp.]|jgi:hypothetical protein|uniref:hypothetical protein n=1 Tax=Sphingobacterium sp. TaxID=341027 RepID=UPI002850B740|nr:hypothetical protein [Sphingobacterium sp.]MDR3011019.1 hypothetical protein [Sphingobacterium sp.]
MKYLLILLNLCAFLSSAYCQDTPPIAVSPIVDLDIPINHKIVNTVDSFLRVRDDYTNINRYKFCEKSDFDRFGSPFFFLKDMENNNNGQAFSTPV